MPRPLPGTPLRIALLGTATLDHLRPYLEVHALLAGFSPSIYVGPYGQVHQEILSPDSGLHRFDPQLVILACEARDLLGDLYDFPGGTVEERQARAAAVADELVGSVRRLVETTRAYILLHDLAAPVQPLMGILDRKDPYGTAAMFRDLNGRLEAGLQPLPRAWLFDYAGLLARVGRDAASPDKRRFLARIAVDRGAIPALCQAYDAYLSAFFRPARKVLVLDLDNTLWGGVIGEDGLQGIKLGHDAPGNCYRELQRVCLQLSRRGVLLALCSKNNPEDALAALRQHPGMVLREDHFAAIRLNWQEKPLNLREIAAELNLGIDALVFVDDNPVERSKVREALPDVLVVDLPADPALYARTIAGLTCFETPSLTEEDRNRAQLYVQRRQTEALRAQSASLEEFYHSLDTVLTLLTVDDLSMARAVQLLARTNQFNLTTRRHTEADLRRMQASSRHTLLTVGLRDRFGDQGLVGLAILERDGDDAVIESLVLSCRVLGRGVEQALLARLEAEARAQGATRLIGRLRKTPKNLPARDYYPQAGLRQVREEGDEIDYALPLEAATLTVPAWIRIEGEMAPAAQAG
jgi:FkbH-like protein